MTEYEKRIAASPIIHKLKRKAESGTITSAEMNKLVGEYGKIAGECLERQLLEEYPKGQATEDDIRRIISPILKQNYKLVSEATTLSINAQYKKAGVGIKAVAPEYNVQRENELVKELSQRSFENELD